jgi:hypothetical protein
MTESPMYLQMHRVHMDPACTAGACQQGRKPCPCPDACQQPEPEQPTRDALRFWSVYLVAVGAALFFTFF